MIKALPKSVHKGEALMFHYTARAHFVCDVVHEGDIRYFRLIKKPLPAPLDKAFVDHLYEAYCEAPEAYGYFVDGKRVGVLEIDYMAYANRVRITELLVDKSYRKRGIGKALMDFARTRAEALGARGMVLETQSCNTAAIAFYEACGFSIIGFDLMAYTNDDVEKGEVRIEMGQRLN